MKIKIGPYPRKGHRKVDIHIDNYDTWNMDNTLAQIIYPMLLQLKATKHGVPSDFAEVGGESYESQDSFDFYKEDTNKLFEEKIKGWDEVLDKMIWSFQQLAHDNYDDRYHHGVGEYDWVETDKQYPNPVTGKMEPTYQMVDKNPDEHWYDHVGHKLHEDRMQEGFELFGKYFRNLWD
jgi:hypothetical protein